MSILSSIGSAISGAYNTAKSTVSNFLTSSPQSLTASAGMNFPLNPGASLSTVKPLPVATGSSGTGTTYYSNYVPSSGNYIPSNTPQGGAGFGTYGPQLPVTISANSQPFSFGGGSSGGYGASASFGTSQAPAQSPRTISKDSGIQTQNTSLSFGGGSAPINSSSFGGSAPISLASAPTGVNPGSINTTGIAGTTAGLYTRKPDGTFEQVQDKSQDKTKEQIAQDQKDIFKQVFGDTPKTAYDDPQVIEAQQRRQQAQQALLAPTAELNAVIAKQNQDLLQLRQTGSQEGVTEAVYGGQQNAINYNAAIRALPLQAVIASKQGDLKLAQDYLTELTTIKSEQIKSQYEYNKGLFDSISGVLDKTDQRQYEAIKTENDRAYTEQQNLIKTQGTLLQSAVSQGASQSVIRQISNARTIQDAITAAGQYAGNILEQKTNQVRYQNVVLEGQKLQNEINAGKPASGEYAPIINAVSSLVGATKAPAVKTAISTSIANGDFKTAYANIANSVEDSLTGTNKTKFADTRTDIGVMSGMRDAIKSYTDAGGKLGYLKGTADNIAKNFGQLATDPKFSALGVQLQREFQSYRLAMTGAAFSPQESKEYAAVNPRTNASLDLNLATIDGALAQLTNRVTSTVNQRIPDAQKIYDLATGNMSTTAVSPEIQSFRSKYNY